MLVEDLERRIEESKAYIGRMLENEAFIGSVARFTKTSYTDPKLAQLFNIIEDSFGRAILLEKEYEQYIHKENNKSKKEAVITYETTSNIIEDLQTISSVRLDNREKDYPKERKPISIALLKQFIETYKEADREGLINSTQRVINYTTEHFNQIRNKSEQEKGTYHVKKDIFRKKTVQNIRITERGKTIEQKSEQNQNIYISPYDFSNVIGLEKQKESIEIRLFNPIRKAEEWERIKGKNKLPNKFNFLFYGPPGTGKTYFAKAVAGELGIPFYFYNAGEFIQPHLGEGKNIITELYQEAEQHKNAFIYIDEVDSILGERGTREAELKRDVLNTILTFFDGGILKGNTITALGTNRYEDLDRALKNKVPITNQIYFGPIDKETKKKVIMYHLQQYEHEEIDEKNIASLINNIEETSMRGISDIAREAAYQALHNNHKKINVEDVQKAITIYQE